MIVYTTFNRGKHIHIDYHKTSGKTTEKQKVPLKMQSQLSHIRNVIKATPI